MNCEETTKFIHAYLDSELDATHSLAMESHLRGCAACSRIQQEQRALKTALGESSLQFKMPAGLRKNIVAELRQTVRPQPPPRRFWLRRWIFAGATLLILGLIFLAPILSNRLATRSRLLREITSSHVRSMMANHLMDVASTDQHTVKPWFDGKLDFAPPVKDLAAKGFPLTGGRLDYIDGHQAAALVYMRQKHIINLFIWPVTTADHAPGAAWTRNGYHLINWIGAGMTFWAVSDLNEKELEEFAAEFDGN